MCGGNSVVECLLAKQNVEGSTPFRRSIFLKKVSDKKVKVKVKNSAKCQKVLEIEVFKDAIEAEFEAYYKAIQSQAEIPGFRKGKAPRKVLEEHYSDKANEKVLTQLVNDNYHKAIEKEKIDPVGMPDVSDVNFGENDNLSFQATVEIRPEFSLKAHKGIKVKKKKVEIKEKDINQVLSYLQERAAQFTPVESRDSKIGDYLICDYSYAVEDKVLEEKKQSWLWVDKEMFLPGLSDQSFFSLSNL